ncbi:pre-rRNA-processing protein esf1 [Orbilia brochopaga]|uniref:Pre-rRNA-processing protein esf1 n=1 Tax=Orbilia brochopaga TaxID=3140254 RepID=A0AAV9UWI6_9PEZI
MAKSDRKAPKGDRPPKQQFGPVITDPRFSSVHSDPRFALPKKRYHAHTIDSRFKKVLEDDDFARTAKVDKYGRPLSVDKRREEIRRLYKFEDEDEDDDSEGDDEKVEKETSKKKKKGKDGVKSQKEEKAKKREQILAEPSSEDEEGFEEEVGESDEEEETAPKYDPARGIGLPERASSPDDDSDSDSESVVTSEAEDAEAAAQEAESIPLGDITPRLAVVNLDWDYIKSADLYVVLSSFVPAGGKILKVAIYPSEFGKERMEREEMEGPPKEVFGLSSNVSVKKKSKKSTKIAEDDDDDQAEITEQTLVKEDTGEEFDSAALRRYQLERLRYFYAIVTCDTAATANAIYTECDGAEFGTTANFFDLRFVPDGTEFDDRPRDECSEAPRRYRPVEFSTDALQHSKVKLTWDQEDTGRKAAVKEAFSRREIEEMDLQAYLASESDEEKEEAREAYRKLLDLAPASKSDKGEKKPVGDMEVTFSAALTAEDGKNEDVFERDETTIEKYVRKEKERKKARKEKMKEKRAAENSGDDTAAAENAGEEPTEDLGFDDPFFENPETANAESKKARKQKKREEKERIAVEQVSRREELEALMAADNEDSSLQHFNMNDILKREKLAKLKGKAAKRMAKKRGVKEAEGLQDDYKMDVNDPRFSAIYEKTEFAIDPTNPRYKKTQAMEKVMEERRKRRAGDEGSSGKKKRRK